MHVSAEEQLRRFEERAQDPLKQWKLADEDWRNREKRGAYENAVNEMLERTTRPGRRDMSSPSTTSTARPAVVEKVCEAIEARLSGQSPKP
jgi:AMP-polyphosphate phosphotransferase